MSKYSYSSSSLLNIVFKHCVFLIIFSVTLREGLFKAVTVIMDLAHQDQTSFFPLALQMAVAAFRCQGLN